MQRHCLATVSVTHRPSKQITRPMTFYNSRKFASREAMLSCTQSIVLQKKLLSPVVSPSRSQLAGERIGSKVVSPPFLSLAAMKVLNVSSVNPLLLHECLDNLNNLKRGMHRHHAAIRSASIDGLRPVDVTGDGSCLFRTVCRSDSGSQDNHLSLHAAAVEYMKNNRSEFA